jgi:hypothetical protein
VGSARDGDRPRRSDSDSDARAGLGPSRLGVGVRSAGPQDSATVTRDRRALVFKSNLNLKSRSPSHVAGDSESVPVTRSHVEP